MGLHLWRDPLSGSLETDATVEVMRHHRCDEDDYSGGEQPVHN